MDFKQLASFCAVVKYKSFTKAAEKLFLSQPTISSHIRLLEEELDSRLILRTTKSIEVTPRGQELYECAQHIMDLKDNLLKRWNEENHKVIQLGASTIPSTYILPEILPLYRKDQEEIRFVIHQSDSQGIIEGLLENRFEVGLVGMKIQDESIVFIPFYQDSMVMITPVNEHFLTLKERENDIFPLEEILNSPILLREQGSGSKKYAESYFEKMGIQESDLHITARLNDQESIKRLVAGGLGISIISQKAAENMCQDKKLLTFLLPQYQKNRTLYLIYRKNNLLKEHTQNFISFIQHFYHA
ncbi:MAG: selenium metabolism-associated LysR family transcriptional regulator [Lachnospiraceae bacterium]|nr:selenium metabolism-associated LysR family transcriptional regulator [Lachnospiraceae bacterium]